MDRFLNKNNGFSLLETVVSIALVACFITGLVITWEFSETRERGLEAYWTAKEELETAYEITHRNLRTAARTNIQTDLERISFYDATGANWVFFKDGDQYKMTRNSVTTDLISRSCTQVSFSLNGAMVSIVLAVAPPTNWKGNTSDLTIRGKVLLRNLP
ncbi:MAG TPA: prepilin-type N-terminal cleavage/methylation domain-containing protein [Bacillota bacterium]|nr:prepilin-type N-terminal cleavage/methylation domain-containing protein [Bacillota bacterium]